MLTGKNACKYFFELGPNRCGKGSYNSLFVNKLSLCSAERSISQYSSKEAVMTTRCITVGSAIGRGRGCILTEPQQSLTNRITCKWWYWKCLLTLFKKKNLFYFFQGDCCCDSKCLSITFEEFALQQSIWLRSGQSSTMWHSPPVQQSVSSLSVNSEPVQVVRWLWVNCRNKVWAVAFPMWYNFLSVRWCHGELMVK